jgi:hypothetical protein
MNWKLLSQIADHIEANPKSFDMETWAEEHSCGTIGCIAGWAIMLTQPDVSPDMIRHCITPLTNKAFQPDTHEGEDDLWNMFLGGPFIPTQINELKAYVPAALRWMAKNSSLDWSRAFNAVGADWPEPRDPPGWEGGFADDH